MKSRRPRQRFAGKVTEVEPEDAELTLDYLGLTDDDVTRWSEKVDL